MKKVFLMVIFELKSYLRDIKTTLLIILTPLIILLIIGYFAAPIVQEQDLGEPFPVAVVNQDETAEAQTIVNFVMEDEELKQLFDLSVVNYSQALQKLEQNQVAGAVVIPPDFSRGLMRQETQEIEFIGNHRQPIPSAFTETMLHSATKLITAAQSGLITVHHFLQEAEVPSQEISSSTRQATLSFLLHSLGRREALETETLSPWGQISLQEYYSVSLMLIFLLLGGLTTLRVETENKEGTLQRLLAGGISPAKIVSSKFLAKILFLTLQLAGILILFSIFLDNYFRGELIHALVVIAAVIVSSAALLTLLSYGTNNLAAANGIGFLFIILMAITGGSIIPLSLLPAWLEPFELVSFFGWASHGLHYALFDTYNPAAIISSTAVLAATALAALYFASFIINKKVE